MKPKPIQKLYYSISEVSKITSLKPYILRYWETEFEDLKPAKNRAGNRIYKTSDINLILLIKKLLYEDKFTIEGTRNKLENIRNARSAPKEGNDTDSEQAKLLGMLRKELTELLEILKE